MRVVEAFTDGACIPNPGRGGWGAVLRTPRKGHGFYTKRLGGRAREYPSTNNRMEVYAIIQALEAIKEHPCEVHVYSDSQYAINCATKVWKRKKHADLWRRLDHAARLHRVRYHWVRGHAGHPGNEEAHRLASQAVKRKKR